MSDAQSLRPLPRRARASALTLVLAVACAGAGCRRQEPAPAPGAAPAAAPQKAQRWHCPMHPSYVADGPGKCPICNMDLVPVPAAAGGPIGAPAAGPAGLAEVTIDAQRQQLIGLRSEAVRRGPFAGTIRTVGRLVYDETRLHHVHTKYEAYVEQLYANFTGKYVRRGEPLLSLYSPDLLSAQQEYLLAVRSRGTGAGANASQGGVDIVESARRRLLLWDISAGDIERLERSGQPSRTLNLYAPISGYVTNKTAYHGMRVKPEDALFDIVDLSRMWVLADVYEYELPRVKKGLEAKVTLSYWPGRSWGGRLTYIYPSVDPKTRTIKVRIEVDNPDGDLKAEMFADVLIEVAPRTALLAPEDAVLETGTRRVVFVALGQGRLQPREVQVGDRAGGQVEIRAGLEEGEAVARGATFLVDSESRLQAALSGMAAPRAEGPATDGGAGPPHEGHAPPHEGHATPPHQDHAMHQGPGGRDGGAR